MWSCSPADLYYTHPLHGIAAYSQSWLCDKDTLGLQAYATTTSNRSSTPGRQNWMQNLGETCSHQPEEFGECCLSDMGARTCRCGGKWVGRPGGKRGRSTRPKRGRYIDMSSAFQHCAFWSFCTAYIFLLVPWGLGSCPPPSNNAPVYLPPGSPSPPSHDAPLPAFFYIPLL